MDHTHQITRLKHSMDGVLIDTGFAGYVGAFATYHPTTGLDIALADHVLPYPNNRQLKNYLNHMSAVMRGDLLLHTNRAEATEAAEEFKLALEQIGDPILEIAFRFTESQLTALYELCAAIVLQPDASGIRNITIEAAREVIRVGDCFIEPGKKEGILKNATLIKKVTSRASFGTSILKAGVEQITQELRDEINDHPEGE